MTQENEEKLSQFFTNTRKFYIINVNEFIKNLDIDINVPSNIYFVSSEIEKQILANLQLKKYNGVIYIHNNINEKLIESLRKKFVKTNIANKMVLIDNAWFPKLTHLHKYFDEILFYERFRKIKIMDNDIFDFEQEVTEENDSEENNSDMIEDCKLPTN